MVQIEGDRFEKTSKNLRISSTGQNVSMQVAIKEEVAITVTEGSGAKISGALVTFGNESKTTGEDGMVTFKVVRGAYTLTVASPGYQTHSETYRVSNSIPKRVQLRR